MPGLYIAITQGESIALARLLVTQTGGLVTLLHDTGYLEYLTKRAEAAAMGVSNMEWEW